MPSRPERPTRLNTRPLSQVEIESWIQQDLSALEEATEEFRALADVAAAAEVEYKVQRAGAYLRCRGTIKDRENHADYVTADYQKKYKIAEAKLKSQREVLATIRARLDALRTLNANVRPQVS